MEKPTGSWREKEPRSPELEPSGLHQGLFENIESFEKGIEPGKDPGAPNRSRRFGFLEEIAQHFLESGGGRGYIGGEERFQLREFTRG